MSRLSVRVQPGARREGLKGWMGAVLRLAVTAPPEGGRANDAVRSLVSRSLGVEERRVSLERGHSSRSKQLEIAGLSEDEVRRRLSAAMGSEGSGGAAGTGNGDGE